MSVEQLVSVVIPALDEEASIGACLESVLRQSHRALEVIVVDGGSTDRTRDVVLACAARDPRVRLLFNPRRTIPTALNVAVGEASGRWLVRVDAHSTVPPDYVSTAVELLAEGRWAGVGGRKDAVGRTAAGRAVAVAMASRLGVGGSTYHHGTRAQEVDHVPFGAYALDVVRGLGGWDERLVANEDFEFDYRLLQAGHRLLFDPRLTIEWQCRQSVRDLFRQYHRYGKGKLDVVLLHPRSMSARHVAPPAFVAYAALGLLVNVRTPGRWAVMLAPYLTAVSAESFRQRRRLGSARERLWLPAAFVAMHVGWGVGFWTRLAQVTLQRGRCDEVEVRVSE